MKKIRSALLVVMLTLFSAFTMVACGSGNDPKAVFAKEEFELSLEETINFFDYLTFENVDTENVSLSFSNDNLFNVNDNGEYTAVQSGTTFVKVMYEENLLTSCKVIVKQMFTTPTDIVVNDEGVISWKGSSAFNDNSMVSANGYIVEVNGVEYSVTGTSFNLTERGEYSVRVKAQAFGKIDASAYSKIYAINYGVLERAEITSFNVSNDFGNQEAEIEWSIVPLARYNVYLDGFKVESEITRNSVVLNFSNFYEGQSVEVVVEAIDRTGNLLSSRNTITVQKIARPTLSYDFSGGQGKVVWNGSQGATSYTIQCLNRNNPSDVRVIYAKANEVESALEGISSGIYTVSLQANGGRNANGYFVNSNTDSREFAKIAKPVVSHSILSGNLTINIEPDSYAENYLISYGDFSMIWNVKERGYVASINISSFEKGKHDVKVTALPLTDDNKVKEFSEGMFSTSRVVNSDSHVIEIYILENVTNISHKIEDGCSILTFDEVEYATQYMVEVGGQVFTDFVKENGVVAFNLGELSNVAPSGGVYKFNITASRDDGNTISSSGEKSVSILNITSKAEEQENGYYAWNKVNDNTQYLYEIYTVDKNFSIGDAVSGNPTVIIETPTSELKIEDKLKFGYYYIRIYSISTDTNLYLDSNFYDVDGYFEDTFFVTEQIETPEFVFNLNDKSITINKVANAERYEIEVNGELVGRVFDNNPSEPTLTYSLASKFDEAGVYEVTVKASADDVLYDTQLHTPSEKGLIYVNKLSAPTFSVDEEELLSVEAVENADSVVIKQGASILNPDGETSLSLAGRNGAFDLVMKFVAKESHENIYYLDSNEIVYHFKRTSQPTNIAFASGVLSFDCEDKAYVDRYIVTLTLLDPNNNNLTITFDIESTTFNLQEFIEEKVASDIRFESAYSQCSGVEVMVSAYKLGFANVGSQRTFFLPSDNGTTASGAGKLNLSQLPAPHITFNPQTKLFSWNSVGSSLTRYAIYVDGVLIRDNLAGTIVPLVDAMDFSEARNIVVVASNPEYLSSANSNTICVRRLQSVSNVGVLNSSGTIYFTLPSIDLSHVKAVYCNNKEVNFNSSNGYVAISLADFGSDETISLSISVKANDGYTNAGITYYFLDSLASNYQFINIDDEVITLNVKDGVLVWNDIATSFVGVKNRPLTYTLNINKGDTLVEKISNLKESKYNLDSEILFKLLTGEYSLKVEVVIDDYSIESVDGSKGYFGYAESNILQVKKLPTLQAVEFDTVEDSSIIKLTDRKASAKIVLSWEDIWTDVDNVSFNIDFNNGTQLDNIKAGAVDQNYSLSLSDGKYRLELNNSYFTSGNNSISISVDADASITSNVYNYSIYRYSTISELSISDDGILTITAEERVDSFLIGVLIGGNNYYVSTKDRQFNIMDGLLDKASGNYTVEVVGFDSEGKAISTMKVTSINGYRLNGISNISILENGNINITLFSEAEIDSKIVFVANYNGRILTFNPDRIENTNTFVYSMLDFVKLFGITSAGEVNLKVSVQKEGNINADWVDVAFNYALEDVGNVTYARGRNYTDDYLILSYLEGTSAFRFELNYTVTDSNIPVTTINTFSASDLHGYWITTDTDEQYFVKELPATAVKTSVECYGISLNDLLKEINGGSIQINISRVQRHTDGDKTVFYQYNVVGFSCNKLTPVTGIRISNDRVTWNASTSADAEYYVYFYTLDGAEYNLSFYKHVTTAYIDIYDIGLVAGVRYYINVVTVSPTLRQIASNATLNVEAFKYLTPTAIEVTDGRLMFNREDVQKSDLFTSIQNNFNLTNVTPNDIVRNIATANYDDIYTFSPSSISSVVVELKFHSLENGRDYVVRRNAVDLMPDISQYTFKTNQDTDISYLQALYDAARQSTEQYTYRLDVERMYNAYLNANGIADFEMLFDEFGSSIPAGDYELSISQEGVVLGSVGYITSHPTNTVKVHVGSAPNINLSRISPNGRNEYIVSFTPTMIKAKEGDVTVSTIAKRYTMYMVSADRLSQYFFTIENNGTDEEPIYEIINVMTPTKDSYGKVSYKTSAFESPIRLGYTNGRVVINFTNDLLPAFPDIVRATYSFTIFAQGNDVTINSKTDMSTITLLGIDYTNINLNNGVLTWRTVGSSDYKTRVTYKKEGEGEDTRDIDFINGQASLSLPDPGEYKYIIISILGTIGQSSMTVDSESYLIENIYKLTSPSVSKTGNVFTLTNQNQSKFYAYTQFEITNNVAKNTDGIKSYLTSLLTDRVYNYSAGILGMDSTNADYAYKATEQDATEFYFASIGNSTRFVAGERLGEGNTYYGKADFVLVPPEDSNIKYCVLNSNEVPVSARMLKAPTDLKVENGDIVWTESPDATSEDLPANSTLVYEINIHYYKAKEDGSYEIIGSTATFYTTGTTFDTINIVARDDAEYYIFEVRSFVFSNGNQANHDITTIDGQYFRRSAVEYLSGGAILGSEYATLGNHTSTISKIKPIINQKIANGEFTWQTQDSSNGYECVVVDGDGNVVPGELFGAGTTNWSFIPDITYENNPYSFKVYVYDRLTTTLKSNPVAVTLGTSSEVRVLPMVTSEDFTIEKIDNGYRINLENLYTNKQIYDTDVYYNVKMTVEIGYSDGRKESLEVGSFDSQSNSNRNFILTNDIEFSANGNIVNLPQRYESLNIKFQVLVRTQASQSVMLLNGKESEWFALTPLAWDENDKITWNPDLYQFEWTFGEEDFADALFNIDIQYSDGNHEISDVAGLSYQPHKVGTIISARLLVRKDANSLYSTEAIELHEVISFYLFEGGDGSQTNPYRVASASQFANIKYRNSNKEKFYFRQTASFEVSATGFAFDDTFYGEYDGGGFTITFTGEAEEMTASNLSLLASTSTSETTKTFVRFGSLFKGIDGSAKVSNLKLNLNFNSTQTSQNTLFAGLAVTNYGQIENVEILSINTKYSIGRVSDISIAQVGLVAINYGRIINCVNSADINMTATAAYTYGYNLIVSGLVFTNDTSGNNFIGTLTRCFNKGKIDVSVSRSNSAMWISGVVLNNIGGKMAQCGNDGNINANGSVFTSYIAGVVMRSIGGDISYTYNNGEIKSNSSSNYAGGVAYYLRGVRIAGLVDTNTYIARVCTSITNSTTVSSYCKVAYQTSGINIVAIEPTILSCGDGHSLTITAVEDGYKASIS